MNPLPDSRQGDEFSTRGDPASPIASTRAPAVYPEPLSNAPGYVLLPRMPTPDFTAASTSLPADRSGSWSFTLICACLAVGLLGSIVRWEQVRLKNEQGRAAMLAREAGMSESLSEDVGKLMADPATQLIRLTGSELSTVKIATLAWNPRSRSGVLFCDQLPPIGRGQAYQISSVGSNRQSVPLTSLTTAPGTSTYFFHLDSDPTPGASIVVSVVPHVGATDPVLTGTLAKDISS